jgi:hypothetical protein
LKLLTILFGQDNFAPKPKNFRGRGGEAMIPIGNDSGLLVRFWESAKERGLKDLAWSLREYADMERRKEPDMYAFSRSALARRLGKNAHRIREVLEFMENIAATAPRSANLQLRV